MRFWNWSSRLSICDWGHDNRGQTCEPDQGREEVGADKLLAGAEQTGHLCEDCGKHLLVRLPNEVVLSTLALAPLLEPWLVIWPTALSTDHETLRGRITPELRSTSEHDLFLGQPRDVLEISLQ